MPQDEQARLDRLRGLGILDSDPEQRFDRITRMAADILKAPIALISLIDSDRQWFKARVGLDATETPRSWAFCAHAIKQEPHSVMVVEDARQDSRFQSNPLVVDDPDIRFYAGATLTTDEGINLGTLCVIDVKSRPRPSDEDLDRLRELAAIAVDEMELSRTIREADRRLALIRLSESMSGVGFWRFDTITSKVIWSDQVYAIYGLDPQTFDPNLESVIESYHPDDRPILEGLIQRALQTGEGYSFDLRIKRVDGQYRRVTAKATAESDPRGRTIALNGVFQDVTDYVRAHEAVAASEARYRLLADTASDVVLEINVDGTINYASPSIKQFGWTPDDMVSQRVLSFIHPDDAERVGTTRAAVLAGKDPEFSDEQNFRIRKADGDFVWVEVRRSVIRNQDGTIRSVVSQLRDVSERHEANAKLTASEARYRMIADNTTDVIGRVGLDGVMRYVSPAITRLTGYSVQEMEGRKSSEFTHPEDIGGVVEAFRAVMAGKPLEKPVRYRIRHKDTDEWIWVEANPRLAVGLNGEVEFIDVMRDVRAQIATEASMLRARTEAEAGARAKADFLANMSHEIRTPLNGIVGYAALLASSPDLPAKHHRHVEVLAASSKALIRIVDDILDFSALDSGDVGFELRPFNLRELLRTSVETLQVQAAAKKLVVRAVVDARMDPLYLGDAARIRQVLMNLIGNAIKFTSSGEVDVRWEPIADGSRQTVRCMVRDTGIGIAADKVSSLFSRFSQADTSITRRYGGTGLGLAIAQKIIRAMGGDIGVDSTEGAGSTFWFTLPLSATDDPKGLSIDTTPVNATPPVQHRRILVVDDHDINRELAAVLLSSMRHEVVLACSGEQAVQFVEREAFDLIFMDIQMPGMDGFAATRAIRAMDVGKTIPIIALTAHAMRQQIEECLRVGMDGHVAKPFTAHTLQTAVEKWATTGDRDENPAGEDKAPPTLVEFRRRFIARAAEDANDIRRFIASPSPTTEARAKTVIHQLAGTAGSLGFHEAGQVALAIDSSVAAGDQLSVEDLSGLLNALQDLQPAG